MSKAERLATRLQERYEFRVALNSAIMDPFEAPPDPRDEELRDAATELRRLSKIEAEVEALREALKVAHTYVDAVVANATGSAKRKNYQKCLQIIDAAIDAAIATSPGEKG